MADEEPDQGVGRDAKLSAKPRADLGRLVDVEAVGVDSVGDDVDSRRRHVMKPLEMSHHHPADGHVMRAS